MLSSGGGSRLCLFTQDHRGQVSVFPDECGVSCGLVTQTYYYVKVHTIIVEVFVSLPMNNVGQSSPFLAVFLFGFGISVADLVKECENSFVLSLLAGI